MDILLKSANMNILFRDRTRLTVFNAATCWSMIC